MSLADNLRKVLASGKVRDAKSWALDAGLSEGAVRAFLLRSRRNPDAQLKVSTLQALAKAAGVNATWLMRADKTSAG